MANKSKISLKVLPPKSGGKDNAPFVLSMQGVLGIDNAAQLQKFLLDNLGKSATFILKLNNVDTIDVATIQLLQRFFSEANQLKKEVVFDIKLTQEQQTLLRKSGFDQFLSLNSKQ